VKHVGLLMSVHASSTAFIFGLLSMFGESVPGVPEVSNHAGWVGAGLLGAVLAWLCWIRIPAEDAKTERLMKSKDENMTAKDAQIERLIKSSDERISIMMEHQKGSIIAMSGDHREQMKAAIAEFRSVIQDTASHCDKEVERLLAFVHAKELKIEALTNERLKGCEE
jgi:hypothetical protein